MKIKNRFRCKIVLLCLTILFVTLVLQGNFSQQKSTRIDADIRRGVLKYDDPVLIAFTREKLIVHPNPYWSKSTDDILQKNQSQLGQDLLVDKLLNNRTHGFFIEAGAFDPEFLSNTFFFEKKRYWTGLLIEPDPRLFEKLKPKRKNSYLANNCLSVTSYAVEVNFTFADSLGGLEPTAYKEFVTGNGLVQCVPIMTFLLALNRFHIDYFSLDIEGAEIDILRQIDFDRVRIDVLSVEYAGFGQAGEIAAKRLQDIRNIVLNTTLYDEVTTLGHQDVIFLRKSFSR